MRTGKNFAAGPIIIAGIIFLVCKLLFFRLFALLEPTIKDIHFQITERPGQFPTSLLFALMMAAITIMIAAAWQYGPVISTIRRAGVVSVIIAFMIAGILVRHQLVKNYFNGVARPFLLAKKQLPMNYPIDPANFVYYMFAGCCVGCIVSFFLFRQKKYNQQTH